nr:hypothetical protein [Lachnospiraceae bacterium]
MKSISDILKKIHYVMTSKQKLQYIFVMLVALVGSFCELISVSAVLPFIQSVMMPDALVNEWYYKIVARYIYFDSQTKTVTVFGVLIIIVFIVKNLYLMFSSYVQSWYSTTVQSDLSIKMEKAYLNSSYLFHLGVNSSLLIRSIRQDVDGVFALFLHLFRI